jgi:hypothetical protein
MEGTILHIHEPRIGIGLPTRTVRPHGRKGDEILAALLTVLEEPVDRVVVSGRMFERADPAAHLVDRVVAPLRDLVGRGVAVTVPSATPRALLFLAAGIALADEELPGPPVEFWRFGRFRIIAAGEAQLRQVALPGIAEVSLDLTDLPIADALELIRRRLSPIRAVRMVRLTLCGRTAEQELLTFGPREIRHYLPGGVDGAVLNELTGRRPGYGVFADDAARKAALDESRRRLPKLPETTGVYEFRDGEGRPLYVGKAVNLRRRVASHFTAEARQESPRGPMLLAAQDVVYREAATEVEALLAEADRIREVRPPYNRQMRETEGYRYLRADVDSLVPGITSVPETSRDGAVYVGPFPKRFVVERSIRTLMVIYGLKSCDWKPVEDAPPICTDRDLGICSAPCVGRVSLPEYRERVMMALDDLLGTGLGEPPFGALNSPATGLLATGDLRILTGFRRSVRYLLENLRTASGTLPLSDGRTLLVLGGRRAGIRKVTEAQADEWRREAIAAFSRRPARTFVAVSRVNEVRILSRALRERGGSYDPSPETPGRGMESPP